MNKPLRYKQKGLTLVEMMIAFTLSMVLVLGLLQIFDSNKKSFSLQSGIARLQENGRIGLEFLGRDFRSAGFMGCATGGFGSNFTNNVDVTKYSDSVLKAALGLFDGDQSIIGFNDITVIPVPSTLDDMGLSMGTAVGNVVSGTDAIFIQGVSPCDGGKVLEHNNNSAQLKIEDAAACGLNKNDIVVVSNCNTADAFGITDNPLTGGGAAAAGDTLAHGSNLNVSPKLANAYDDDSYLYTMKSVFFYIGNGVSGEPALFMKSLLSAASATPYQTMELAEGIENMQLLYGEDQNGDGSVDRYLTSDLVADMNAVIAIKVALLARSEDRATTIRKDVFFAGATVVAPDLRFRVPFESTVTIRNRAR